MPISQVSVRNDARLREQVKKKQMLQLIKTNYLDDGLKKDSPLELAPKKLQPPMHPQLPATVLLMLVTDFGQRNHNLGRRWEKKVKPGITLPGSSNLTCASCGRVFARKGAV